MSKIEWTDETWNPTSGCTRVSAGCDNCYAVAQTRRLQGFGQEKYTGLVNKGKGHFNGVVKTHESELAKPFTWKKPKKVFVNSMSDLFHPEVPFDFIDKVFAVMALTPQHTYQILTKRPERMAEYLDSLSVKYGIEVEMWKIHAAPIDIINWPLPNVWLGTSVEDQAAANERIQHLLRCPAAVRFLSIEPLLGPVDLWNFLEHGYSFGEIAKTNQLNWIIVGGESGPGARPMDIQWAYGLVAQAKGAGVSPFVKQLGSVWGKEHGADSKGGDCDYWPEDLRVREFPKVEVMA